MKIDLKKELSMPKLSLPKLGKPSLSRRPREINAAPSRRPRGPEIKAPKVVTDLVGDLRDRHLLPLVAVLIVAIIAAPIVFGGKGGSDEPAVSPVIAGGAAADSAFTVVPAEESLRSPEKRLGHRHPLNPFRQAPAEVSSSVSSKKAKELAAAAFIGAAAEASAQESPPAAEAAGEAATPAAPASEPAAVEPAPPANPAPSEGTAATEPKTTTESSKETVTAAPRYVVTMKTGFTTGKPQEQVDVQPMTKLAGEKNPAILYVGLTQDQKRALFLLTTQVTAYYGAAHCTLDKTACELVELQPGKSATFEIGLGEEATRYKIFLQSIEPAVGEESKTTTKTETRSSQAQPRVGNLGDARRFNK